ncbi:hypothetical protein MCOR25_009585 [Pyricularia grisea]|uniref:HhH-GPD domain-containing protein n=1 Tax=Pyricularia grisea TaxID=148305 RepID=A0A6P8B5V8_PYRGI|nr:hypothetical protein PgNI_05376 [Pyricularia grisea]KAI6352045.1 hypothetical protein MCOR25_009585 [Pyricularia grisea]TLD10514.1 hypothetical protein PgNI_05376 [Pyricularia grisea]
MIHGRILMARVTRSTAAKAKTGFDTPIKTEQPAVRPTGRKRAAENKSTDQSPASRKRVKSEAVKTESAAAKLEHLDDDHDVLSKIPTAPIPPPASTSPSTSSALASRKLKQYYGGDASKLGPFPNFPHPTPAECKRVHRILAKLHGARKRPTVPLTAGPAGRAGCGDAPSVLDALVRTILSQNTSDSNSARAKRSMDRAYGGRHDNWPEVVAGGVGKLEEAIRCGGLSVVKSRVIMSILETCVERYGVYSLDHLREASDEDAMREMLAFKGVGPKTASCVLLFCLGRESFAVDTHVHRLTGMLGWRPAGTSREEAHLHLDARIPDEDKYGLHVLLITHGKRCAECKAGGKSAGRCELRKALKNEDGDGLKGDDDDGEEKLAKVEEEEES